MTLSRANWTSARLRSRYNRAPQRAADLGRHHCARQVRKIVASLYHREPSIVIVLHHLLELPLSPPSGARSRDSFAAAQNELNEVITQSSVSASRRRFSCRRSLRPEATAIARPGHSVIQGRRIWVIDSHRTTQIQGPRHTDPREREQGHLPADRYTKHGILRGE